MTPAPCFICKALPALETGGCHLHAHLVQRCENSSCGRPFRKSLSANALCPQCYQKASRRTLLRCTVCHVVHAQDKMTVLPHLESVAPTYACPACLAKNHPMSAMVVQAGILAKWPQAQTALKFSNRVLSLQPWTFIPLTGPGEEGQPAAEALAREFCTNAPQTLHKIMLITLPGCCSQGHSLAYDRPIIGTELRQYLRDTAVPRQILQFSTYVANAVHDGWPSLMSTDRSHVCYEHYGFAPLSVPAPAWSMWIPVGILRDTIRKLGRAFQVPLADMPDEEAGHEEEQHQPAEERLEPQYEDGGDDCHGEGPGERIDVRDGDYYMAQCHCRACCRVRPDYAWHNHRHENPMYREEN